MPITGIIVMIMFSFIIFSLYGELKWIIFKFAKITANAILIVSQVDTECFFLPFASFFSEAAKHTYFLSLEYQEHSFSQKQDSPLWQWQEMIKRGQIHFSHTLQQAFFGTHKFTSGSFPSVSVSLMLIGAYQHVVDHWVNDYKKKGLLFQRKKVNAKQVHLFYFSDNNYLIPINLTVWANTKKQLSAESSEAKYICIFSSLLWWTICCWSMWNWRCLHSAKQNTVCQNLCVFGFFLFIHSFFNKVHSWVLKPMVVSTLVIPPAGGKTSQSLNLDWNLSTEGIQLSKGQYCLLLLVPLVCFSL